jgi:hypothetical protein
MEGEKVTARELRLMVVLAMMIERTVAPELWEQLATAERESLPTERVFFGCFPSMDKERHRKCKRSYRDAAGVIHSCNCSCGHQK